MYTHQVTLGNTGETGLLLRKKPSRHWMDEDNAQPKLMMYLVAYGKHRDWFWPDEIERPETHGVPTNWLACKRWRWTRHRMGAFCRVKRHYSSRRVRRTHCA